MLNLSAPQLLQVAAYHYQAGHWPQAEVAYRQILQQQPDNDHVLFLLGTLVLQTGRQEQAVDMFRRAVALQPTESDYHLHLGAALHKLGRLDEAQAAYQQALVLSPGMAEAQHNLGLVLEAQGQMENAVALYRQAIALQPNAADYYVNLAGPLRVLGRLEESIAACRMAIALKPEDPEAYVRLGHALRVQGRLDDAIAAWRQALSIAPNLPYALANLGLGLYEKGLLDEAFIVYRKALAIQPDYAPIRANLSLALLVTGQFAEGWDQYEWRDKLPGVQSRRHFPQPLWDGADLAGRTILIHCEQGLGDTIQFVRYLPLVAGRGGRVILACQEKLLPLFRSIDGASSVIADTDPVPSFDVQCPLLSLPRIFRTNFDTIPAGNPYLFAREDLIGLWRRELGERKRFKVGICWAGSPQYFRDQDRSIPLALFEPLARISNVQLISLQKGPGAEQLSAIAGRFEVTDVTDRLDAASGPFMDTAAIMRNLDLVVTVDTVTCHLAGALGVPVWTLLSFSPDWRWFLNRSDSPWYPTMRLFRQPEFGDWNSVLQEVARALKQVSAKVAP